MVSLARLVLSLTAAFALAGHPATRIPVGVRTIGVHTSRGVSRRVADPEPVARIVRWFDALPDAPRGVYYCPLIRARPATTTLEFRGAGGAVLARARAPGSAACGFSLDFSVRGHAQRPVLERRFLVRVGQLIGLRLVPVERP